MIQREPQGPDGGGLRGVRRLGGEGAAIDRYQPAAITTAWTVTGGCGHF